MSGKADDSTARYGVQIDSELAQRERDTAVTEQQKIVAEIALLRASSADSEQKRAHDLELLEAQASEAARMVADMERARADAQAAAVALAGDLAAHKVHEGQVRTALEVELEEWMKEQTELEGNDHQRSMLANQKAHLDRIKQRAAHARVAAKAHDQALLDELAKRLREPDNE